MGPCGICLRLGDWSSEATRNQFTVWNRAIGYAKTKDELIADLLGWECFNFQRKANAHHVRLEYRVFIAAVLRAVK
jgi:hypothetical protein